MQKKGGYINYSIPGHPTLSLFVFVHSVGLKEKKLVQRTTYNTKNVTISFNLFLYKLHNFFMHNMLC